MDTARWTTQQFSKSRVFKDGEAAALPILWIHRQGSSETARLEQVKTAVG
jgi:hypothetical protein